MKIRHAVFHLDATLLSILFPSVLDLIHFGRLLKSTAAGNQLRPVYLGAQEDTCEIREDLGQMATEVKIVLPMSHNALTRARSTYNEGVCT